MLDETVLRQLYLKEQFSIREIATMLGLATRAFSDALIRYRIPRQPRGGSKARGSQGKLTVGILDEATVRRLHLEEGKSIIEIARVAHCSLAGMHKAMIRWNIPRRRQGPR